VNLSTLSELLLNWVKNQGAALLQGKEPSLAFQPGTAYQGKVMEQMANGRYLVQVAGQNLDMNLPAGSRSGDSLQLTFMNGGPRPTFLLGQAAPAVAGQVQLSSTAQQVTALLRFAQTAPTQPAVVAANAMPAAAANGAGARVGSGTAAPGNAARATGTSPPVSNASSAAPAGQSAGAGTRPIVSHVVMVQNYGAAATATATATGAPGNVAIQFAPAGVVSPGTVLLDEAVDSLWAAVPASTTLKPNVMAEPAVAPNSQLPFRLSQTLSESGLFYESHLMRWTQGQLSFQSLLREPQAQIGRGTVPSASVAELGGMPEEAARLAGRQLNMLEGMPFHWQGLAWPGQWIEWLVQERPEGGGGGGGGEEASPWVTELRLTMPRLGPIQAQLNLSGVRLGIRLSAADITVRDEMKAALPSLAQGLEAAGLKPVSLNLVTADAGA
jgi:hypothetical protein